MLLDCHGPPRLVNEDFGAIQETLQAIADLVARVQTVLFCEPQLVPESGFTGALMHQGGHCVKEGSETFHDFGVIRSHAREGEGSKRLASVFERNSQKKKTADHYLLQR